MTAAHTHDILHAPGAPILKMDSVRMVYNGKPALSDVTFSLHEGDRLAVVGPNGAGKSTLFKVIAGVLRPSGGTVTIGGSLPAKHICIAYLPQRSDVDWSFPVSVFDVVMMGRTGQLGFFRRARSSDRQFVRECLDRVALSDLMHQPIHQLSGGQQQRMFVARALAQEAEIMLMDEPLTGLDGASQEQMFQILEQLKKQRVTVLVATHDLNLATERFDRVMLLNRRIVGFGRAPEVFTHEKLKEAYGAQIRLVRTEQGLLVLTDTCCEGGHTHA